MTRSGCVALQRGSRPVGAVAGVGETEARLRQVLAHHLRQAGVVFDHQELLGHGWVLGCRECPPGWITMKSWCAARNNRA